jgi:ADP-heptose:LPS heptosyltransferase
MSGKKHILVIRLSAMGDVAMTVPLIRALVQQHPDVRVTVLSRAQFAPFFEGIAHVSFHAADVNSRHKGFLGLLRLYRELKDLHIDAVADLHNVLRSKVLTSLFAIAGKKTATTDKARAEKKALTRSANKIFKPLKRVTERHAEVFVALGCPIVLSENTISEKLPLTEEILAITGPKDHPWIGIAPFAQHRTKEYPEDLLLEVLQKLSAEGRCKLLLFGGGKAEVAKLERYAAVLDNAIVVAGRLNMKQELELMPNLDVMLSMDSGNGHLAAMMGTKVITLWGATHPYAGFAPFNQPLSNSLTADREQYPFLPTSVYGNKQMSGYEDAMRTISPDTVVNKIREVLNNG